ncbi:hypothetical protein L1887_53787 [Cichorium endivia]|nr:hypothetical protein L1887_53787 [Cichorium endivia]
MAREGAEELIAFTRGQLRHIEGSGAGFTGADQLGVGDDASIGLVQVAAVEALGHAGGGDGLRVGGLADHQVVAHDVLRQVAGVGQFDGELLAALVDDDFLGGVGHLVGGVDGDLAISGHCLGTGNGQQGHGNEFGKHLSSPTCSSVLSCKACSPPTPVAPPAPPANSPARNDPGLGSAAPAPYSVAVFDPEKVMSLRSVCVFCGASTGVSPVYREAAVALGQAIARRGLTLVYGGGAVGLMGIRRRCGHGGWRLRPPAPSRHAAGGRRAGRPTRCPGRLATAGTTEVEGSAAELIQRQHRHPHLRVVMATAEDHTAQRRDIGEVAAPAEGDVLQRRQQVVGGIEVDPTVARTEHRNPGMRGIGADQPGLPGRRPGQQVTADITCRQAAGTQAGKHQVGEVLADPTTPLQHLQQRRGDLGRTGIEGPGGSADCRTHPARRAAGSAADSPPARAPRNVATGNPAATDAPVAGPGTPGWHSGNGCREESGSAHSSGGHRLLARIDMGEMLQGQALGGRFGAVGDLFEQGRQPFQHGVQAGRAEQRILQAAQVETLEALGQANQPGVRRTAQALQRTQQRAQLEQHAMGVLFIQQKQVQRRDQLRHGQVTGAIGDAAVGQFQQPFQAGLIGRRRTAQETGQAAAQGMQTLDPPPRQEETPALVAGHVVQGEARQRGHRQDQSVEKVHQFGEIGRTIVQALRFPLQLAQGLPVLPRQFAPHLPRRPLQALQVGPQAEAPVRVQQCRAQARVQGAFPGQQLQAFGQLYRRLQSLWRVAIEVAAQQDPQQPRAGIAALAITPEPEQVLHHPRRQVGIGTDQVGHAEAATDLPLFTTGGVFAEDPRVLAGAAALHRHHFGIGLGSHPGQAARQHPPALGAGHGIHAHAHGTVLQAFVLPHRRLGQLRQLLGDVGVGTRPQALGQRPALGRIQVPAQQRLEALRRECRLEQQFRHLLQCLGQRRRLAAPPAGDGRQDQLLAQQSLADRRQETRQSGRLQDAAAQCIGHQHPPLAYRIQQAGDAQGGVGAQFEGIAEIVVEPAQDGMHPAQAAEGLEVDGAIAHGQVAALHQRVAELAGEEEVFEPAFVEASGGQQHHQRCFTSTRGQLREALLQGAEEARQVLHMEVAVQLGKGPGDDGAVFQGVTGARRRLGAIGGNPPAAVRASGQVGGVDMQPGLFRDRDALAWPEEVVVTEDQLGGQQAFADQLLRAVDVRQHGVQQPGTLGDATGELVPLGGGNHLGQQVQLPGAVGAIGVGVDVVGDAVFPQLAVEQGLALGQLLRATALQVGEQFLPVRTHAAVGGQHFMPGRGAWGQGIQQVGHRGAHRASRARECGKTYASGFVLKGTGVESTTQILWERVHPRLRQWIHHRNRG